MECGHEDYTDTEKRARIGAFVRECVIYTKNGKHYTRFQGHTYLLWWNDYEDCYVSVRKVN